MVVCCDAPGYVWELVAVGEYHGDREISQESNSKQVSGSSQGTLKSSRGRMIKKKRDPDYVYS